MIAFCRVYPAFGLILPQAVAKIQPDNNGDIKVPQPVAKISGDGAQAIVQRLVAQIPWGHNILLMEKVKDLKIRTWYMQATIAQGWSRDVLLHMIEGRAHARQGKADVPPYVRG